MGEFRWGGPERRKEQPNTLGEILSESTVRVTCVRLGPNWRRVRRSDSLEYILLIPFDPLLTESDKWFGS